jgi:hypothetical protein
MSLSTHSKFFYGFAIDSTNLNISFSEGGPEIIASVDIGNYSFDDGLAKLASAMTDAGTQTYTVLLDRGNRLVTINATSNFTLKVATATPTTQIYSLIGFTGSDRTGTNTYTANLQCGGEYRPQFLLQDYIKQGHFTKSIDATVKKTASGLIEVVRFGSEQFVQFNIKYATNKRTDHHVIKYNPSGVEDLVLFMEFLITKQPFEFMPDIDLPNNFVTLILDKTPQDSNGTAFQLKELYDKNLPEFFESGILLFRVVT